MRAAHALVALLVLLAGCSAGLPGGTAEDGTVNVYVSDEPGAIEEFEHLNVTITSFSLRSATSPGEHGDKGHHRHHHDGNWTTYDLNETTVDLTQLRGVNASLLHAVGVPNGEYTAVSVTVADVNGTLTNGESVEVRVPRNRLTIEKSFTVGNNESVDFVVDAVVRERRANETYVLKPNLNASGTDVPMEPRCCCRCSDHSETNETWECNGHHDGNHHHHDGNHHGGDHSEPHSEGGHCGHHDG